MSQVRVALTNLTPPRLRNGHHRRRRNMRTFLIALVVTSFLGAQSSFCQTHDTLVFEDVTVVPMDKVETLPHRDVLVQDGIIRSVDQHEPQKHWPVNSIVVAGAGKYLLPGFSDMHIHTYFGDEQQLKLYIVNGITTVLNLSGSPKLLEWKAKIAAREILGPSFYTSGPILDGDPPTNPSHTVVKNRVDAEREVDEQARRGYDFIKPYSALSQDAYEGIVDAAKRNHIRLVGHVSWNVGVRRTIDSGQDAIAHVEELYRFFVDRHLNPPPDTQPDPKTIPALVKELREHNVWVITTLSANTNILKQATNLNELIRSPEVKFIPRAYLDEYKTDDSSYAKRSSDWVLENKIMVPFLLKLAASLQTAGVHLMAGTDATNPIQIPGISLHDELEQLVQSGFTPYEALVTSTRNPQLFLGRFQDAGTVTPGKVADLVLLDGNPLESITNTRKISGVAVRGQWFDRGHLEKIKQDLVAHFAVE